MSDLEDFFRWAKIDSSNLKLSNEKSYPEDFIGYHIHDEFINTTKFNRYYINGELLVKGNILHFQLNTKNQNENTHSWKIISCFPYEIKKNKIIKNVWFVYMNPIDYYVDAEEYINPTPIKEYKRKQETDKNSHKNKASRNTNIKPVAKSNTTADINPVANSNTGAWQHHNKNVMEESPRYEYMKKTITTVTKKQLYEQFKIENQNKKDLNLKLNALKNADNEEEHEESKTNEKDHVANEEEQEETKTNEKDNTANEEEQEETKTNEKDDVANVNPFETWNLNIRNKTESESNFKLAKPFPKKYLKSPNGKNYRQLWMAQYYSWYLMYGKCIDAPIVPDNFTTLQNDIDKWDEWEATYDTWFFDFMSTNIMK